MIKIAIVDDDRCFTKQISEILKKIMLEAGQRPYCVELFEGGEELLECKMEFDLLLLDIDMPQISGFDLVDRLNRASFLNKDVTIIYISNYENLVFESFKYSPLRFVRKKNLYADLSEAINAYLKKLKEKNLGFMFSTSQGKKQIYLNSIMYVEVISHKLYVHEKDNLTVANGNLKYIEDTFLIHGFIKTHQSFLINYRYINFIRHNEIILDDGTNLPLSRGRYEQVKNKYMFFSREM